MYIYPVTKKSKAIYTVLKTGYILLTGSVGLGLFSILLKVCISVGLINQIDFLASEALFF